MSKVFVKPKDMPQEAFDIWERVYEANKDKGQETASKIAWSAVKNGWKQENGKWVKKNSEELVHPHFRGSITDLGSITTSDKNISIIEVMKTGKWHHDIYGDFEITTGKMDHFIQNFNDGVRKAVAIDVEHKSDEGAVGWVKKLFREDNVLYAEIEWTDEGVQLIKSKKYRFFSPEFADEWDDPVTGATYNDVLVGGGITNRPFFQELEEIVLSDKTLITKKMGDNMKTKKCTVCGDMIPVDQMDSHMKKMHPDKGMSEKGGEKNMTRDELKAKLLADPSFVPTDADKVEDSLFSEVKKEIADEAGDGGDGEGEGEEKGEKGEGSEGDEAGEGAGTEGEGAEGEGVEASDKTNAKKFAGKIVLSTKQYNDLTAKANQGVEALKRLQMSEIKETVRSFTYSTSNEGGVILPKTAEKVEKFMLTLGEKQRETFKEILSSLPKIKLFGEIGSSVIESDPAVAPEGVDQASFDLDTRAKKLMSEQPTVYKTYSEAVYAAEKQLKEEGKLK